MRDVKKEDQLLQEGQKLVADLFYVVCAFRDHQTVLLWRMKLDANGAARAEGAAWRLETGVAKGGRSADNEGPSWSSGGCAPLFPG